MARKRAARDELHRNVGELLSASADLVMTLQALRVQHESATGRWVQRLLLLTMRFAAKGGYEALSIKDATGRFRPHEALATALPAAAAATVSLLYWDRDATTDVRSTSTPSMTQLWGAIAALRSSGDEQFQRKIEDLMTAVESLQHAYGKNDQQWTLTTDELTKAIREVAADANRVTTRRWWKRRQGRSVSRTE
jgi:hypothetical protein